MTDKEIGKGKALLTKLEDAYNAYYDTTRGMPYDIDVTLRETAICLAHLLGEVGRLKVENKQLYAALEETQKTGQFWLGKYKTAKADGMREFARKLKCGVPQETGVIRCSDVDAELDRMLTEVS